MVGQIKKKLVFTFFSYLVLINVTYAQKITGPVISKPVYFDLSPPLRSIPELLPGNKENRKVEKGEKEIWNYFKRKLKNDRSKKYSIDSHRQGQFGKLIPDSALSNFEGTPNVNTAIPPDTYGDVGSNYYFHMVNLSFTIFDKAGNIQLGPTYTGTIWNGLPYSGDNGDGIVLYDDQADRWLISSICMPFYPSAPFYIMIAVSQSGDPTGSWFRWEYSFDFIPDYPKLGIWGDSFFMTCNLFSQIALNGVTAIAFDKMAMLAGNPSPAMVQFVLSQSTNVFSLLPADCDGLFLPIGTPGYFGYLGNNFIGLYEFHTDWSDPAASTFGNQKEINVGSYSQKIKGIPQKGSVVKLDPVSDRLMCRLQVRKFADHQSMVVNHTVRIADYQSGIRWYELRRTSGDWSMYQQSTYAPDSNSRWMGSMALDSAGNIALGYSVSGPGLFPSVRYTGRMKNDPLGQMTIAEQSIIEGGGAQTHPASTYARWGDYSSMTIDPSNPSIFWYTQQYYPVTADYDWHTRISSFTFANILDIKAIAEYSNVCPGQEDRLNVEVSGGTGNYTFSWTSIPTGFTSTLKNPLVSPEFQTKYIVVVTSGNKTRTDTVQVNITPAPSVYAGEDTICCRHISSIQLTGQAANYISVKWLTSGDGIFADPQALYTSYVPGVRDKHDSLIDLELIAYPQPSCPEISDHKIIRMITCLGISPIESENNPFLISPNPSHGRFLITLPDDALLIEISDMQGKMILKTDLSSYYEKEIMVDLSNRSIGLYPVKIILKNKILRGKMVLE